MKEKFRCHPSIILENLSGIITFFIILILPNLDDVTEILTKGGHIQNELITIGILGLLSFIIIYNILIWSKTSISIEENTIIIKRNTIISSKILMELKIFQILI